MRLQVLIEISEFVLGRRRRFQKEILLLVSVFGADGPENRTEFEF